MYKYRPQNPDELELNEGDTVYVLEKCDDGWYVGSSQRTGRFGTFPGIHFQYLINTILLNYFLFFPFLLLTYFVVFSSCLILLTFNTIEI